jgi:tRNA (guanosine-2'-O-)-methyltransferase
MILQNEHGTILSEERNTRVLEVLHHRQPDLTVVLENVDDPHNIAAVLRSCDAVGVREVFVLNTVIHPYQRFASRPSSSANKWMQVHQFTDTATCIAEVRKRYQKIYSTHLGENSQDLYSLNLTESVALVFGNEKQGLSSEILPYCDANFIIPQVGMIQSLNISVACAVSLYEAFRQKRESGHYAEPRLDATQTSETLGFWNVYEATQ